VAERRKKAHLKLQSRNNHPLDAQFIALGFKEADTKECTGNPFGLSDTNFKVRFTVWIFIFRVCSYGFRVFRIFRV
jgi:hypothetical protein